MPFSVASDQRNALYRRRERLLEQSTYFDVETPVGQAQWRHTFEAILDIDAALQGVPEPTNLTVLS